jgi:hypothetical protein
MHLERPYYSFDKFYSKLNQAISGKEPFSLFKQEFSFPRHLYLPKGSPEGMKFKFFYYIGPYQDGEVFKLPLLGDRMLYNKNLGFPLDRPVSPFFFQLDNVFVKDEFIYHKKDYMPSTYAEDEYTGYSHKGHHSSSDFAKFKDFNYPEYTNEDSEGFSTRGSDKARNFNFMHY